MNDELQYLRQKKYDLEQKLSKYEEEFDKLRAEVFSIHHSYRRKFIASSCIGGALFVAVVIATVTQTQTQEVNFFNEIPASHRLAFAFSLGIALGIIPLIVIASLNNLNLQWQNAELYVKYSRIRELRSQILSIEEKLVFKAMKKM
jgi:hypothetical protein